MRLTRQQMLTKMRKAVMAIAEERYPKPQYVVQFDPFPQTIIVGKPVANGLLQFYECIEIKID